MEKALHQRKKQIADYEKAVKEYNEADKAFRDSLSELFRSGKGKTVSVSRSYGYRSADETNRYELTIEFPASVKPPKPVEQNYRDWEIKQDIEELENAIAVLKMTDEEVISTSTYKGVARFIK